MRIAIPSLPSPDSVSLKAILEQAGYLIVTDFPSYTITLTQGSHPWIVVDVPDAIFGRLLTHRIGELAPWNGVFVKAKDGNQNDKAAIIEIPDNDAKALEAVCVGTMRALDQLQKVKSEPAKTAGTPFLNASELLANAVDVLRFEIHKASTTVDGHLTQVIVESRTATDEQLTALAKSQTASQSATYSQIQHGISETLRARQSLFDDLMKYYQRPRAWQWRYWFPTK